jgi:hypothetical protein
MQRSKTRKRRIRPPPNLRYAHIIHPAPNGDLFVADSQAGSILVMRGVTDAGKAAPSAPMLPASITPLGSRFTLLAQILNGSTSATPQPSFDSPTSPEI